ncbi:MAG: TorD/DmsD family molecular chaperone [Egibacteraceae bacterium]
MTELLRALAAFAEEPGTGHEQLARSLQLPGTPDAAAFTEVFVFNLYPYASVYLGAEGQLGGEARDRVAGFFRAVGAVPPPEPDHLATLLVAYAQLGTDADADEAGPRGHAARTLLHEHLLPWLPLYLARITELASAPYAEWGLLLGRVLLSEACRFGEPPRLPLHLRAAPPPDLRTDDLDGFVDTLLAPARSGMVLTGSDLVRAARDLRLGLRIGERRFVLRALLSQQPPATLEWLAAHTVTTSRAWCSWAAALPGTAAWWTGRAEHTNVQLRELAKEAGAQPHDHTREPIVVPRP